MNAPLLQIDFLCSNPLSHQLGRALNDRIKKYSLINEIHRMDWNRDTRGKYPEKYCVPILNIHIRK